MKDRILLILRIASGIIYVILAAFAIYQASLDAEKSTEVSNSFTSETIYSVIEAFDADKDGKIAVADKNYTFEEVAAFVRKFVGHFGLFAAMSLFGFIFCGIFKNKTYGVLIDLSAGFSVSVLTEIIQVFVSGRAGSISDVILNTLGIVMIICLLTATEDVYLAIKKRARDRRSLITLLAFAMFSVLYPVFNDSSPYTLVCYRLYTIVGGISALVSVLCLLKNDEKKTPTKDPPENS